MERSKSSISFKDEENAVAESPKKRRKALKFTPTAHTCTNAIELPRGIMAQPLPEQEYLFNIYDLAFKSSFFGIV